MTRRITWIILLTVWATLIAGSVTAYLTTRAQMLRHLDHVMMDQLMQPRIEKYRGRDFHIIGARHQGDRTETAKGKQAEESHAELIRAVWIHLPGEPNRRRSIVARVWALPVDAKGQPVRGSAPEPIVLAYSREAYEFDPLMNRVALALVTVTLVGGVIAAVLASRLTGWIGSAQARTGCTCHQRRQQHQSQTFLQASTHRSSRTRPSALHRTNMRAP